MLDAATPTQSSISEFEFDERRVIGRALRRWDQLRENQSAPFPDRARCLISLNDGMSDSLVVIAVGSDEKKDRVIQCGAVFREALARDPRGLPVGQIMPSTIERGLVFWRIAAEMKKPIADVGGFTNARGEEILYRSVFLPVTDDGGSVTHLIGAFSYKTMH
jgi:hypothetical protein